MRLRFTIRDLLWLIVVVALAVGWFRYRCGRSFANCLLPLSLTVR